MSSRSWFYASEGTQQGPCSEVELRESIAAGTVTADTFVWSEGMTDWQKAAEIPGLLSSHSRPPVFQHAERSLVGGDAGGSIAIDVGLWDFLGRGLLFVIGFLLVIPAPWVATSFYRWIVSRLRVPQRPDLAFTGQPMDIWYVYIALALVTYAGLTGIEYIQYLLIPLQGFLSWMTVRWISASFSSQGRQLPIVFNGNALTYVGWFVLLNLSFITVIGWAWVTTAWIRWICRNIDGTRREIVFNASGLEMLWRTLVFALGSALLIPIPWVLRWYARWYVSQFALEERTA